MKRSLFVSIFTLLGLPSLALGQNATSVTDQGSSLFKNVSMIFDLSTESNLYTPSSPDYSASSGFELTTSYTSENKINTGFTLGASKDLTNEREQTLNDSTLFTGTKLTEWKDVGSLSGLMKLTLPTNETSREVNTLKAAVTLSSSLKFDLKSIHLKYVDFKYTLAGTWYFNKYTTTVNSTPNTQKRVTNTFSLSYAPFENTAFLYDFSVAQKWTYGGRTGGPSFGNTLAVAQTLTKNTEIDLGISNKGNVYKANGIDNNISIYDSETATVFGEFIVQL